MDAILNQATAGLEKDIKPQREPTPEKVEEEAEEESEEEAEEESEEEDEESAEISEFVIPKERTMWQKFTQIRTIKGLDGEDIHPWWVKPQGEHGALRTVDVMERYRAKMKRRRDLLDEWQEKIDEEEKAYEEEEAARLRKYHFDAKVRGLKRGKEEKKRIRTTKIKQDYKRKIAESRVYNLLIIGREGAERKKKAEAEKKRIADEEKRLREYTAYMKAKNDRLKEQQDAEEEQRQIDAKADLLMRKFGVMEAVPKPYVPKKEAPLQGDEEFVDLYYEHPQLEDGTKLDAVLSADLNDYPYCRAINCFKIGKYGAKELSITISPRQVLGTTDIAPGACEGLRELNMAGAKILAQGINDMRKAFLKGAVPKLQILKLDDNNFGCTGARCIAECLEHEHALSKLKYLSMRGNSIQDHGGMSLASGLYKGLTGKLEELDLSQNIMRRGGVLSLTRALQTLPYKKKFKVLRVRNNRLKVEAMRHLSKTSPPFLVF